MFHKLQDGAIFIADSHYPNHKKEEFLEFLEAIESSKIKTSQLIFMGDIFDLLVGDSKYLQNKFKDEIELINNIAKKIEVIYLEGNHDFNLKIIFKNIKIVKITCQPLIMEFNGLKYALSHGDKFATSFWYKLYTSFIRNPIVLKILPDNIAKWQLKKMQNKKVCKEIEYFEHIANKIISKNRAVDFIVEGHFHQGKIIKNYISLPSFACDRKLCKFQNGEFSFFPIS